MLKVLPETALIAYHNGKRNKFLRNINYNIPLILMFILINLFHYIKTITGCVNKISISKMLARR